MSMISLIFNKEDHDTLRALYECMFYQLKTERRKRGPNQCQARIDFLVEKLRRAQGIMRKLGMKDNFTPLMPSTT